ncbi:MAG: CrcB family protein [Actinomycetota bacterium]
MVVIVAVAIFGGLGAVVRYRFDGFIQNHVHGVMPLGTLTINVTGSLMLGVLVGLNIRYGLSDAIELAAGTGFCGGFTTFSGLMYESTQLVEEGTYQRAVRFLLLSMALGGFAAAIGLLATGAL